MHLIKPEDPALSAAVERLYDDLFGPARFHKASYLYREGVEPAQGLSWVALEGERLVGVIRYWPVLVGPEGHQALLLGPLAIAPEHAGRGIGRALVFQTLDLAQRFGHDLALLVGDVDYYQRFGFVPATPHGFVMPGENRPDRLQVAPLRPGILGRVKGEIRHIHSALPAIAARQTRPQRSARRGR
jgi:predicted N-acetyltransferase YhbS